MKVNHQKRNCSSFYYVVFKNYSLLITFVYDKYILYIRVRVVVESILIIVVNLLRAIS